MRILILILFAFGLAGCHGEPVPPDYQNLPTMTASVDNPEDAPAPPQTGTTGTATPEPDSSAEGTSAPYEPVSPPSTTPPPTTPP
ncbi:MAG TPA: hypothetical protein VM557_12700 [Thermoanaerobaculia bacterium]|nr:hypothetical protein [Thermoanaerobaculia bacterium]